MEKVMWILQSLLVSVAVMVAAGAITFVLVS